MFEAYSIGVKISLINRVSPVLGVISSGLLGTSKNVDTLQAKLAKLGGITALGFGMQGAGRMGFHALSSMIEPAKEYGHQIAQLNVLGMQQAEVANVISKAWETSRNVITSSAIYRKLKKMLADGRLIQPSCNRRVRLNPPETASPND